MRSVYGNARCMVMIALLAGLGLSAVGPEFLSSPAYADVDPQPKVVTCSYLDARGLSVRKTSGLVMDAGLLVTFSALQDVQRVEASDDNDTMWTADSLIALYPEADIALLSLANAGNPSGQPAVAVQPDAAGLRVQVDVGPEGPGTEGFTIVPPPLSFRTEAEIYPLGKAYGDGAAAVLPDGRLAGICFDLSDSGFEMAYMVGAVAVSRLLEARGEAIALSTLRDPVIPSYKDRDSARGLAFRAALLLVARKLDDARSFVDLAMKKDEGDPDALYWMGKVDFESQRYERAAEWFEQAAAVTPEYDLAWHMAGASHNENGAFENAATSFHRALESNPKAVHTWCNLGTAEYNLSRWEAAETAYRRAMELDPRFGLAPFNLGVLYLRLGRREDAEAMRRHLEIYAPEWAQRMTRAIVKADELN